MSVLLLKPYGSYAQGDTVDLDNATEASLVAQGIGKYVENPGSSYFPLTAAEQQNLRGIAVAPFASSLGVGTLVGDEIAAPNANITIASVATAGALTGTFYYACSFVTPLGETAPYAGTNAGTGSITSKQVSLSAIPVSPDSRVTARKLWRTNGVTTEPKDYQYLATINDNTTSVYVDNDASASGIFPNWTATNRGRIGDGESVLGSASDQTTFYGFGAFGLGTPGYASSAFGYYALARNTTGRRNTAVGVYALESNTTGFENTAVGVHSGGGLTNTSGNTLIGYAAGDETTTMGNSNTAVGAYAFSAVLDRKSVV